LAQLEAQMDDYTVSPLTPLHMAFSRGGSQARTVIDDGKIVGVLLMRSLIEHTAAGRDIHAMAVRDAMLSDVICMEESANGLQAARLFAEHKMKSLTLTDHQGHFVRSVEATAIIAKLPSNLPSFLQPIHQIMIKDPKTTQADVAMDEAIEAWLLHSISCLAVCDDDSRLVGMLSETDVVRWILAGCTTARVADYMTSPTVSVAKQATVRQVWDDMCQRHVRRVLVVDDDGRLAGLVTATDILLMLCQNLLETLSIYRCPDDMDMMLEWRKDGMITAVSEKVLACFGATEEELIGLQWQAGCADKMVDALMTLGAGEEQDVLWEIDGAALPFVATRDSEQSIMWWRLKLS